MRVCGAPLLRLVLRRETLRRRELARVPVLGTFARRPPHWRLPALGEKLARKEEAAKGKGRGITHAALGCVGMGSNTSRQLERIALTKAYNFSK